MRRAGEVTLSISQRFWGRNQHRRQHEPERRAIIFRCPAFAFVEYLDSFWAAYNFLPNRPILPAAGHNLVPSCRVVPHSSICPAAVQPSQEDLLSFAIRTIRQHPPTRISHNLAESKSATSKTQTQTAKTRDNLQKANQYPAGDCSSTAASGRICPRVRRGCC